MHTIHHDPSEKIMAIIPALREYILSNKEYGGKPILAQDFKKLLIKSFTEINYPTGKSTMNRIMQPFMPYSQKKSKFIDSDLVRFITLDGLSDDAVYDVLYFHLCLANPLLGKIVETTIYPYMITKDQVTRERVISDLTETAGQYNRNTIENVFIPMTKHGFMIYDHYKKEYSFTYKSVHPITLLYATYRELYRLGLKVMGVHRIDSLMKLEYTKWFLLTRSQLVDIIKKLDGEKLAGYSFQLEEQLHVKHTYNDFLKKIKRNEVKKK